MERNGMESIEWNRMVYVCYQRIEDFSIVNLLAFYYKCCNLIGYATRYLFRDR